MATKRRGTADGEDRCPWDEVRKAVAGDGFWSSYFDGSYGRPPRSFATHLAVFQEPYLEYVLVGRKTVESRFSVVRCAPYQRVRRGDVLLLKRSGGPVVGLCRVGHAWFYQLDPTSWKSIRSEFAKALCAQDPEFWKARSHATFATLMTVESVIKIDPVPWKKRDRRGWVVVSDQQQRTLFGDNQ